MEFTSDRMQKPGAKQELAETQAKLQPGLMFRVQLPPEADAHYAGKGVSLGAADTPIFWYRPKDSEKYRVIYADLSVRDAETPPSMPVAQPEKELIEMFREYSELSGGSFPNALDMVSVLQVAFMKKQMDQMDFTKKPSPTVLEKPQEPSVAQEQEAAEAQAKLQRGLVNSKVKLQAGLKFAVSLPPEADSHYAGKGVSLGAVDTPIFWYRPKDSEKYRVIYADLSVRDAETPPSVPDAQPEQDLIDTLPLLQRIERRAFPELAGHGVAFAEGRDEESFFRFSGAVGQGELEADAGDYASPDEAGDDEKPGEVSARLDIYRLTAAGSRRTLRGQRRFAGRGRHAYLLVPPQGQRDVPDHLRRSLGP